MKVDPDGEGARLLDFNDAWEYLGERDHCRATGDVSFPQTWDVLNVLPAPGSGKYNICNQDATNFHPPQTRSPGLYVMIKVLLLPYPLRAG